MAQQPNVELRPGDLPRALLDTAPARRQPDVRPGTILTPDQKPEGRGFGTPGPDTGYALRILAKSQLPMDEPTLRRVLAALMGSRAAHFGRGPTIEDLDVALLLAGLGRHRSEDLDRRRQRWMDAVAHEASPGRLAVAEVADLLHHDPEHTDLLMRR